jgi:hypothetical protein
LTTPKNNTNLQRKAQRQCRQRLLSPRQHRQPPPHAAVWLHMQRDALAEQQPAFGRVGAVGLAAAPRQLAVHCLKLGIQGLQHRQQPGIALIQQLLQGRCCSLVLLLQLLQGAMGCRKALQGCVVLLEGRAVHQCKLLLQLLRLLI